MGFGWDEWDEGYYRLDGHNHPFHDTLAPGLKNGKVPGCPVCDKKPDTVDYGMAVTVELPPLEETGLAELLEMSRRISGGIRATRRAMFEDILNELGGVACQ